MRFHGLMQAFSRTNRIYDSTKTFGNIVTFRDLERSTIDAITLFGDKKHQKCGIRKRVIQSIWKALLMLLLVKLNAAS
ncbi:type I restriction enzyme subunit R domain-containing protein [Escherichia coli]